MKLLEIFYRTNGAVVEGLDDMNGHIPKVVGEGEIVNWGGERNKVKRHECEITKNIFLHGDLLKLCLKKKYNITEFFPETTVFYD